MEGAAARGPSPWLGFGTCCAIWGSTFLFIRMGNDAAPPVWSAAVRLSLAAPLFALLAVLMHAPWPRGAQLRAALAFGLVDFGVSLPLLYWGEQRVPSGIAAVLFSTIPLVTSLLARLAGLEPLRTRALVASIAAIGGVALMFSSSMGGSREPARLTAVALAAMTASVAGVLLKRAPGGHPFATNAWAHAVGALVCWPVSLGLGEPQGLPGAAAWIPIAYLTLVGSLGAFATFAWLLQRWTVTRTSFIAVVVPVVALLLGAIVRHEHPGGSAIAGSVVILGAVVAGIAGEPRRRAGRLREPA